MDERIDALKDTVKDLILNIITRIDDVSNDYDTTGAPDSERLSNLFEDLQALTEGLDIIKESYPDLDLFEFREKVDMMESAMVAQDTMLLFDILRFELKGLLTYWTECL